jgi:phage terminase small subunit
VPLTAKQARFVAAYDGNAADAARKAGYSGTDQALGVTGYRLLKNPQIKAAIAGRESKKTGGLIATREKRQAFWSAMMEDVEASASDRLRASELLGKAGGDFLTRVEVSVEKSLEQLIREAAGAK